MCGIVLKAVLVLVYLAHLGYFLNIPLPRYKQTCFVIPPGSYQLQYVVSGNSQKEVRCRISEASKIVLQVIQKSQFEGTFDIQNLQATICFASLDTQAKSVSFDFIRTDDPLRGIIKDTEKMAIHETLFNSYQQLEKLYRDQHFFLERNFVHQIILRNTEVVLVFFLLLKLVVVFMAACLQLFFIKQLIERNYQRLPSESSQQK